MSRYQDAKDLNKGLDNILQRCILTNRVKATSSRVVLKGQNVSYGILLIWQGHKKISRNIVQPIHQTFSSIQNFTPGLSVVDSPPQKTRTRKEVACMH